MQATKDNRLGTENITRLMISLAIPSVLAQIVNVLYNIVDRIYIGRIPGVGAVALTGVGITFPIITIISAFSGFASGGGAPLAAIALGQGDRKRAERILGNCVSMLLFFTVILMAFFFVFQKPLLYVFGASDNTIGYSSTYISIYLLGTVFVELAVGLNTFISAQGQARTAMFSVLIGAVVNIVLDPIFIFVFHMGVAGAAVATVISQIASCVIGFAYMHRKYALLRFSLRELRLDVKTAGRILQVGAPMAIQQSIVSCGFLFLQRLVNLYGESMIASYTVATRMENILMIPILGVQNTMATFAGQNMGAQRPDRVSRGLGQGVLVSLSMTLVLCLCQIFGISRIIRAFQLDEAAAAICRLHLFSSAVAMPIFAVYFPANGMCQGVGEGFHATFFALLALGLRVIFAYALHNTALFGYTAVWWSQAMAWTVTLLVCYTHVFRGKWKNKSLI